MPQTAMANLGLNYNWDAGSDGWAAGMDYSLIGADTLACANVLSLGDNTPPGSPGQGDAYVLGGSPTGAWATHAAEVAVYYATTWRFFIPREGWWVYVRDEDIFYLYDGSAWIDYRRTQLRRGVNSQTGTSYQLVLADAWRLVEMSNGAANTLTVPPNSTEAFPIGTELRVAQGGAGTTSIAAGGGVTLLSRGSLTDLNGQEAVATLLKTATDTWRLFGDLA